jgi:GNAT superfamily N-acetyltransferase
MIIRLLADTDSISELTVLLHSAYASLAAMGFNYTAVDQSEDVTRRRVSGGICIVAVENDTIIGTVIFYPPGRMRGCPSFERADVAAMGQFAVDPKQQGRGIGKWLLREVERRAIAVAAKELALDTAEGAHHLIGWYEREGFKFVEHAQWKGKTYRSVVMSKALQSPASPP